jgi:hypothetical protein
MEKLLHDCFYVKKWQTKAPNVAAIGIAATVLTQLLS